MKVKTVYKNTPLVIEVPDEVMDKALADYIKKSSTGWADSENRCWVILPDGSTCGCGNEDRHKNVANLFTSITLAENIAKYQTLDRKIRRRIAEVCGSINWNKGQEEKWFFQYNYYTGEFQFDYTYWIKDNNWYFDTEAHARQILDEFKDDLIWYFTKFKDRIDTNK